MVTLWYHEVIASNCNYTSEIYYFSKNDDIINYLNINKYLSCSECKQRGSNNQQIFDNLIAAPFYNKEKIYIEFLTIMYIHGNHHCLNELINKIKYIISQKRGSTLQFANNLKYIDFYHIPLVIPNDLLNRRHLNIQSTSFHLKNNKSIKTYNNLLKNINIIKYPDYIERLEKLINNNKFKLLKNNENIKQKNESDDLKIEKRILEIEKSKLIKELDALKSKLTKEEELKDKIEHDYSDLEDKYYELDYDYNKEKTNNDTLNKELAKKDNLLKEITYNYNELKEKNKKLKLKLTKKNIKYKQLIDNIKLIISVISMIKFILSIFN